MKHSILALICLASPLWAHDVWVVDSGGGGDFVLVQDAVDAAQPGDTVLVRAGTYSETVEITGKGLQLVGMDTGVWVRKVNVAGGSLPEQDLFVASMRGRLAYVTAQAPAIRHPRILLDSCNLDWGSYTHGVHVQDDLKSLVLVDSESRGADDPDCNGPSVNTRSGIRLDQAKSCDLFVYHSLVVGGGGSDGCFCFTCDSGGDGGIGIFFGGELLHTVGATIYGGIGGCGCWEGLDGQDLYMNSGVHEPSTASLARLRAPKLVSEGESAEFVVEGKPGARVTLISSPRQGSRYLGPHVGALLLGSPLSFQPLGPIPADGVLHYPFTVDELPAGEEGEMTYYQAVVREQGGTRHLTNPSGMLTLDSSL